MSMSADENEQNKKDFPLFGLGKEQPRKAETFWQQILNIVFKQKNRKKIDFPQPINQDQVDSLDFLLAHGGGYRSSYVENQDFNYHLVVTSYPLPPFMSVEAPEKLGLSPHLGITEHSCSSPRCHHRPELGNPGFHPNPMVKSCYPPSLTPVSKKPFKTYQPVS